MKTIMVVDDDEDTRRTIQTGLEINGFRVMTAVDGEDCINQIRADTPDLVLLDVMMPGIPVKEVIDKIKDTRIVLMTIVRETDVENRGLFDRENVIGFFQKPFNVKDLVTKIEEMMKSQ